MNMAANKRVFPLEFVTRKKQYVERVAPVYQESDYTEFPTFSTLKKDTLSDLVEFDKYVNFDLDSIQAVKIREAIVQEINVTTPELQTDPATEESKFYIAGFNQSNNGTINRD
jgi:hypothetical protein